MTRAYLFFLAAICASAGCFSLPPAWPGNKPLAPPDPPRAAKPGPVTPDQVNDANARQQANALQQEIDLDVNAEVSGMTPADAQAKRDEMNKDH
jgi:hypothetical protein